MYCAMRDIIDERAGAPPAWCDIFEGLQCRRLKVEAKCLNTLGSEVAVVLGERLARYGFADGHPFGPDRHAAFVRELEQRGLPRQVVTLEPRDATSAELQLFHTTEYVHFIMERSQSGVGFLDGGDTPAYRGVFEAASCVVGSTLTVTDWI